jgi:hypothetical protein
MRSQPVVSLVGALLATLALPALTQAQPPSMVEPERPSKGPYEQPLFVAGAATFLGTYGLSFGVAASSLDEDLRGLYIPLVGPWIALGANHPCGADCGSDTRDDVLLVLDGAVQAAAVTAMVTSLVLDHGEHGDDRDLHLAITSRSVGVAGRF